MQGEAISVTEHDGAYFAERSAELATNAPSSEGGPGGAGPGMDSVAGGATEFPYIVSALAVAAKGAVRAADSGHLV